MGGNIFCAFTVGDRMNSKTMKIADQEDALTIETPYSSTNKLMVRRQEKKAFDGKENEIDYGCWFYFTLNFNYFVFYHSC
jgi:hypothetical protein